MKKSAIKRIRVVPLKKYGCCHKEKNKKNRVVVVLSRPKNCLHCPHAAFDDGVIYCDFGKII